MGQTDRRTDGRTPDRYVDPAPHTIRQRLQAEINTLQTDEAVPAENEFGAL